MSVLGSGHAHGYYIEVWFFVQFPFSIVKGYSFPCDTAASRQISSAETSFTVHFTELLCFEVCTADVRNKKRNEKKNSNPHVHFD
jgi:hypothetical protein